MAKTIKPAPGYVVIEPIIETEKKSKSGIILPNKGKQVTDMGTVIASVPNEDGEQWKVGSTVVFNKYAPTEITVNDKELLIASDDDILATLMEEDEEN